MRTYMMMRIYGLFLLLSASIRVESAPLAIHKTDASADVFALGSADKLDAFTRYCKKNVMCESSKTLHDVLHAIKPPMRFSYPDGGCAQRIDTPTASEMTIVPFRTNASTLYATIWTSHAHPVDIVVATFDRSSTDIVFIHTNLSTANPHTLSFAPSVQRGYVLIGVFSPTGEAGGVYFTESGPTPATCVTSSGFLVTCSPLMSLSDQPCAPGTVIVSHDLPTRTSRVWVSLSVTLLIICVAAAVLIAFYVYTYAPSNARIVNEDFALAGVKGGSQLRARPRMFRKKLEL